MTTKPTSTKSKYAQIKIKILPEDLDELNFLASQQNLKAPAFIRNKLGFTLDKKDERKSSSYTNEKIIIHKADPKLIYQLTKIGVNINQIAKSLNRKDSDINILKSLQNIEKRLENLL